MSKINDICSQMFDNRIHLAHELRNKSDYTLINGWWIHNDNLPTNYIRFNNLYNKYSVV